MQLGVDLSSNNPTFDFNLAAAQGCRTAYVKIGGDNIPEYFSPSYTARADAAHALGWPVGSYWITGGHNPDGAAAFATAHLEAFGGADYIVLDNETLDEGNTYTDDEAAEWVRAVLTHVHPNPSRIVHYGSKSFMESHSWPQLLATGCSFLIADYNDTPFQNHVPSSIPADRVVGHQYADNGNIGGASPVDLNVFTDAFINTLTTASIIETDDDEMLSPDAQTWVKTLVLRESRGRLYYCATPPAGLPNFVLIWWDRDPAGGKNILYATGQTQADHWNTLYSQTADTVEQVMKYPLSTHDFGVIVGLAQGTDSAYTNPAKAA